MKEEKYFIRVKKTLNIINNMIKKKKINIIIINK